MKNLTLLLIVLYVLITYSSCKNCYDIHFPYIGDFIVKNTRVDSVARVTCYNYINNSNFTNLIDSSGVSFRQYNSDLDIEPYLKSNTNKEFKYVLFMKNGQTKEYKVKLIEDACENCGDCEERIYPKVIEVNGIRKVNNSNVISLD